MEKEIIFPTECPSCNFKLVFVNTQLFCKNTECEAQSTKKVEAFCKKMRILGMGKASIEKLNFTHFIELYETTISEYVDILGEKVGTKVFDQVQKSKSVPFWRLLSSLSIPLIGESAARKLAVVCDSFDRLDKVKNPIGEKAYANLIKWKSENNDTLNKTKEIFNFIKESVGESDKGSVCITGKLNDFKNRNMAKDHLESLGYTVVSSVSSKTKYLVVEDGSNSSKKSKAESLNIQITTIKQLENL